VTDAKKPDRQQSPLAALKSGDPDALAKRISYLLKRRLDLMRGHR
jgi:hypothetical protein